MVGTHRIVIVEDGSAVPAFVFSFLVHISIFGTWPLELQPLQFLGIG
jgi:hypothetical protein